MAAAASQPTLRLLIVDDHADSARALSRLFRHDGHLVITAHTMNGALALVVGQQPVDVVISDIGLPDGDGCELLRRLREFYGGREVAAVALSGIGDEDSIQQCREAGYREFLLKPTTYEQVRDAVMAATQARSPVVAHDPSPADAPVGSAGPAGPAAPTPAAGLVPLGGVPAPFPVE